MAFLAHDQLQHAITGDRGNRVLAAADRYQCVDQSLRLKADQVIATGRQLAAGQGLGEGFAQAIHLHLGPGVQRHAIEEGVDPRLAIERQDLHQVTGFPAGRLFRSQAQQVHRLALAAGKDIRRVTGYQDFVDDAPADLVYVAHHVRLDRVPASQRSGFAQLACGAIAQNVYLYAASAGLATVLRGWIDLDAIARALGLSYDQQVILSQTIGYPAAPAPAGGQ